MHYLSNFFSFVRNWWEVESWNLYTSTKKLKLWTN